MTADVARESAPAADSGISRRTVVRGAVVTAWAVPAVTLVTAAPAFAVSATLALSGVVANYLNGSVASTVDPTTLNVNATVVNTGTSITELAVVSVMIPGNLYNVAPTGSAPGFGNAEVSGDFQSGWTLAFTAEAQVPTGVDNGSAFVATIALDDNGGAPYRKWAGNSFALTMTASAANATTGTGSATVATTPNGTFTNSGSSSIAMDSGTGAKALCTLQNFWNAGRSSIGQITVLVTIPKSSDNSWGSVWRNVPQATPAVTDGKWDFIGFDSSNNLWRWTFRSKLSAYTPVTVSGTSGPAANNSFYCEVVRTYYAPNTGNTLPGGRTFTVSAPRADTKVFTA